jgi:hypothetical protein
MFMGWFINCFVYNYFITSSFEFVAALCYDNTCNIDVSGTPCTAISVILMARRLQFVVTGLSVYGLSPFRFFTFSSCLCSVVVIT